MDISSLTQALLQAGQDPQHAFPFRVEEIPGDIKVLKILVEDREELPVFVSVTGDQLICISYLFKVEEVKSDLLHEMNAAMLGANISMPLSAFARINDQYAIFGALSLGSSLVDVIHEIQVLSSNAIEAITAMREYLV